MKSPNFSPLSLLDNSSEFLCGITDANLRFLHSNKLFKKQFGLDVDQKKGLLFHEVIQSFQIDKFIRAKENCLSHPENVIAIEIKSYQGQDEHWFRWEISAIPDEQNKIREISFIGTDITKQKKVEQELIQQAVLLDNISDAVISTDMDLHIKSWNLSSEMLFGFTPQDVLNRPMTDFFIIKTLGSTNEDTLDVIRKNGFWKGELLVRMKDGKRLYMQSAISVIKDNQGQAAGLISVNKDITNEKRAAEELVIKREEFTSFMENTAAMAWINDENGTLYYMNSLYKKVFGLTDKALGKNLFSCFPEEMTKGWLETDLEVLNNNARIDRIEKGTDKNGDDVYYQVYKFPVKTLSGKKLVGGQAINITEKKISRLELEKQKKQFHSFMENTPSLAWINDEEGNIYYMNSLFKEAFGVPEDINGRNIFEFYPESMRPNCKASDEMVLQTRSSVEVFETGVKPDGKPVYYRVYKFPVESTDGKRLIGGQAIDITGETISKQQLVLEKSQFRSFMDNAPLLAWIVDEQGITRYMNSTFKRSSGFTDENLGKDNHDLYPEVIREKAKISIKEVLAGNQIIRYGYQYTDDNGKPRHFEACKFPIRDQDGNRMVGGQSMEITNLVEAGQQMLDQKNRFESFMENAPQLAWVVDENGTLLYMNSRFKAAFRFSDDMIGLNIREMSSPDKSDRALLENRSVMDRNKAVEYLQDCVDQNGNTHHFRTYKFPMPSNDGKILIGNQSIDITSEVNAKEALNKMHERFEYAGKATRDVIWDWDLQTNRIQRFGGSNAFFDYSSNGDLMDFNNDNIHPDDAEAAERSLQEAIHGDASRWMSEFRYKCAENTYKHVIDQAYIIRDGKGRAIRLIGSMQDVSEERRLQREVLEAEMKKKQDMVTAALIAQERERKEISEELHDNVNQLLASALLFLKIVAREQSSASEYVKQSIEYISNAVSEIRSISHTLNPGILKHNGICAALGEMASGLCIPGKFQVVFNQQLKEPDKLSRELQLALYRIAQEIMNNILKYAEATEVFIQLKDDGQQLELDIDDNGRGFDQSVASKGLGIINIISRAESFGGKVELKSSPGNGCRIKVSIPLPV